MARPKSTDPKVAVTLRLPTSVLAVWEQRAESAGRTLRAHLEAKLIEAVEKAVAAERPNVVHPNLKG